MLAKAVDQLAKMLDVPPPSRASSVPMGICGATKSMVSTKIVGASLLAKAVDQSAKMLGCADAFASKPAPTGGLWQHQTTGQHRALWERACSRKRWISR
ncbi:hypothetical protein NX10_22505 [Pseudomonas fluorescens]|nr:hypothetical protein NX10_22505 [Pseudomonas fluorescens]